MTLLKVSRISRQRDDDFALKNISFSQKPFEKIVVAGETGSGKSTLLKIIAGLEQADAGEIWFEKEKVQGPAEKLVPGHPSIAYLSQDFELAKFLRVEQVLEYSNTLTEQEANLLFKVCQIDHLLKRKTNQLSGGERQRIAIARLLIGSPKLFLLDEPFTHLDMVHKNTLKAVIRDIGEKLGITCILVSHDPEDTLSWADRIIVMKNGSVVQKDTPKQIYHYPVSEYVAGLFGKCNVISKQQLKYFKALGRVSTKKKKLFIRPEELSVSAKGKKNSMGKVLRTYFFGSYRELEVSVGEMLLTIKTTVRKFKKGDTVFVALKK